MKAYLFNFLCLNHWRLHRVDILQILGSINKWVNDVYIEHHHSVMARVIKRMFPGSVVFNYIRIASLLALFSRMVWNFFLGKTHTLPEPTNLDAEVEDLPLFARGYNVIMSFLRRKSVPSAVPTTQRHRSEPLKQITFWENAEGAQVDLSNFLFQYFDELSRLKIDL